MNSQPPTLEYEESQQTFKGDGFAKTWCHRFFCDPKDHSPPGSTIHAISQARILQWGAISFST